ncbi:GntR family transcriptional regulator [Comamonadaceae bacterium G21597-S1]|nr:GntR family transcriptional regulator [Comamonadaceae bacterium G21597-S1]
MPSAADLLPSSALQSIGVNLASVLRERIVTGAYAPGEWIRESQLAQEFGYSNGPIREALQLLVGEGLLVRATWRGVRVVELTGREIVEIFQLRMALLTLAAELAATHMDAAQIKHGRQLLKQVGAAKKRGDIDELMALGRQLSQWVCDGSGNQRLASDWTRLTSQTRIYIYASLRAMAGQRGVSADEPWRELIAAIASRDTDAARLAARHLMQRTLKALGLDAGM